MACIMAARADLIPAVFAAYREGRIHDVLLRAKMIDIARGLVDDNGKGESYSLGAVAARAGRPMRKDTTWRMEYARLANVPVEFWPAEALEYIHEDVREPLRLWHEQERTPEFVTQSASQAYAALSFHLMSCYGVRTDAGRVDALMAATEGRLTKARARLQRAKLVRPDGSKDTKAAKVLIEKRWAKLGREPKTTDKGGISLDADACTLSESRVLQLYSEYGSANTLRTRVEDLAQGTELPLQASFDTMKETYRTSSYKPRDPVKGIQMQNFGRADGTRETLCPRPGNAFLIADLSSMEMATQAQLHLALFGHSALADLLNAGTDPHWWFTCHVQGWPLNTPYDASDPIHKRLRDRAKPANFGFPGGLGLDKYMLFARAQYGISFTRDEAQHAKDTFFRAYPEAGMYLKLIGNVVGNNERGTWQHPITKVWRNARYCALANFGFQHLGAIGVKAALAELTHRMYAVKSSALYGCRMWNAVHDEALGETPIDQCHEAALEFGKVFSDVFNAAATPDVPTTAEPIVSMVWSKKAKQVRDEAGRIGIYGR
jgi:DNA polymerase I-like protein with 3'-5' exonuclease and polymerase domains